MPKIHATCTQCKSKVPLDIEVSPGATAQFTSHTVTSPCPNCGSVLELPDGTYAATYHKIRYSRNGTPSVKDVSDKLLYGEYVLKIAKDFDAELEKIEAHHNFELGEEFEKAFCASLRRVLPDRFGVCRGYVVAENGEEEGDDIIIYDQMRFPRLRPVDSSDLERKQRIPVEATFAYIEAKHTLSLSGDDGQSLSKAIEQTTNVKALCYLRDDVSRRAINRYLTLGENIGETVVDEDWPKIRNPPFTAIVSRYVRPAKNQPQISHDKVLDAIRDNSKSIPSPFDKSPDLIVLGSDVSFLPVLKSRESERVEYVSPFVVEGANLVPFATDGLALGVALCNLINALDWIELGRIKWENVIGQAVGANAKDGAA